MADQGALAELLEPPVLSHALMLATLTLLYEPDAWIDQVDESIAIERTELIRRVCLRLHVPSDRLAGEQLLPDSPDAPDTFYVPILTPRKDVLPDLQDVTCNPGEGRQALATHSEHITVSQALIRARLLQTWLPLSLGALRNRTLITENRNPTEEEIRYLVASLQQIGDKLSLVVVRSPDEARSIVSDAFGEGPADGRISATRERPPPTLRAITASQRPTVDEYRLYLLCSMLANRYLKLLRVPGVKLGARMEIAYAYRQHHRDEHPDKDRTIFDRLQDPARELLGARPSHLRFPLPLARRTAHYTFRFRAPTGSFLRFANFTKRDSSDSRHRIQRSLYDADGAGDPSPRAASELGGGAEAYLMLADGCTSPEQLDAALVCYELPPGSTAFAAVVALLVTVIAAVTYLILRTSYTSSSADVPALLVALASSSGVVATPFLPKSELYVAPLLSRAALFATGVLGNLFALWLVLRQATVTSTGWSGTLATWVQVHAGALVLCLLALVSAVAFRRLYRLSWRYLQTRQREARPIKSAP